MLLYYSKYSNLNNFLQFVIMKIPALKKSNKLLRIFTGATLIIATFVINSRTVYAAGDLTKVEDEIEDSRPSVDANHTIQFVTPSGVGVSETITLTFDSAAQGFNLTTVDYTDIDLAEDDDGVCDGSWTDKTLADNEGDGIWGVEVNTTTDVIEFTASTTGTPITATHCVQIEIGTNATGGGSNERINNPVAANYYDMDIAGTFDDIGSTWIVVIATITAEVTVAEVLTFTVGGLANTVCNFASGQGDITTTATSIPFATPAVEEFVDGCQSLTITTNAVGGYTVTVRESDQLASSGTPLADGSCDGSCSGTSNDLWATSTFNGFGYCLHDQTGSPSGWASGEQCNDATPEFKIFQSLGDAEAAETVMSETTGVTADAVYIGYRLSVSGDQTPGVYTNNIIFVATPTY